MAKAKAKDDLGADQVQAAVDAETAKGLSGVEVDPTPNENYSVAGVTSGAPTPETDKETARTAREAAGLGSLSEAASKAGEMVTVTDKDGNKHQMSRKAYELSSDKFKLGGKD